jgi:hypothetical protein
MESRHRAFHPDFSGFHDKNLVQMPVKMGLDHPPEALAPGFDQFRKQIAALVPVAQVSIQPVKLRQHLHAEVRFVSAICKIVSIYVRGNA